MCILSSNYFQSRNSTNALEINLTPIEVYFGASLIFNIYKAFENTTYYACKDNAYFQWTCFDKFTNGPTILNVLDI
jgi:hypothetical protein